MAQIITLAKAKLGRQILVPIRVVGVSVFAPLGTFFGGFIFVFSDLLVTLLFVSLFFRKIEECVSKML